MRRRWTPGRYPWLMSATGGHTGPGDGWRLQNVEELNKLHPRSYFIPPAAERADLKPGDLVKLVFFLEGAPSGVRGGKDVGSGGRSKWNNCTGFLDNQPSLIKTLKPGDHIKFGAEHVAEPSRTTLRLLGYDPVLKVMVNRKVVREDVPPHRAYKRTSLRVQDE